MEIRPEREEDFDVIDVVVEAAFAGEGRGGSAERDLVRKIRQHDTYRPDLSLVAEEDGEVVGHIMLSYVFLGPQRTRVLELAPLAVRPDKQSAKIGDQLSRAALKLADHDGEPLVLVLGHPSYYPRFGFESARANGIEPPIEGLPDEVWMVAKLSNYDPALRGTVDFGPPFEESS